jgi:hypothetical protein
MAGNCRLFGGLGTAYVSKILSLFGTAKMIPHACAKKQFVVAFT